MAKDRFGEDIYRIRRKFFSFLGSKLLIYNERDELVLFGYMKAFKLKEDIRLFADESMQHELSASRPARFSISAPPTISTTRKPMNRSEPSAAAAGNRWSATNGKSSIPTTAKSA